MEEKVRQPDLREPKRRGKRIYDPHALDDKKGEW